MSTSRRPPSVDQRPRRRRRLETIVSSSTSHSQAIELGTPSSSSVPTMNPNAHTFQPSAAHMLAPDGTEQAFATRRPPFILSSNHPLLPLHEILSESQISAERSSAATQTVERTSDDDHEMDDNASGDEEALQFRSMTDMLRQERSLTSSNENNTRSRALAAMSAINAHRRASKLRHANTTSRIAPPPALFVYQIRDERSGPSQGNRPSAPPTAQYMPLLRAPRSQQPRSINARPASTNYCVHPSMMKLQQCPDIARARWVQGDMPVELFEAITQYLSRDDIKNMRLVNKEFEQGVSNSLFRTVVVPFNTELYDMIEQDKVVKRDLKGKGRADESDLKLQWKNAMEDKEDKLYKGHGLRVFQGFGSHIRRFGMSFEVKEDALRNPPQKNALDHLDSYFGSYEWPSVEYTRFEKLAGLERTADETSQMKLAFSHLHHVHQLALCIDSGLGWMAGPDRSMRSEILRRDPPIFGGCSHGIVDTQQQEKEAFWRKLEFAYAAVGRQDELKTGRLCHSELRNPVHDIHGLRDTPYREPRLWPSIDTSVIESAVRDARTNSEDQSQVPMTGVLYVRPDENEPFDHVPSNEDSDAPLAVELAELVSERIKERDAKTKLKRAFQPAHLDRHQKEWLLEAEWAQRAFLMSYMLAIVDNTAVFSKITVLNLARISSGLVPLFHRHDFWEALPNLDEISLGVIPDWRIVERDGAGVVETKDTEPSKAHDVAYTLLRDYVGIRTSITKIKFGWAAGGEHSEGCIGRNSHVLPAPITPLVRTVQYLQDDHAVLQLPHVEHLTLSNCWITPPTAVTLVKKLEAASLKNITFDSVSLTAHPRNAVVNAAMQNAIAANNLPGINQAIFNAGVGFNNVQLAPFAPQQQNQPQILAPLAAQQFSLRFLQGAPAGQPIHIWAHHMIQQMQQMMTQNGIANHQLPQVWLNHPVVMTLGQIAQSLSMLAGGGMAAAGGLHYIFDYGANAGAPHITVHGGFHHLHAGGPPLPDPLHMGPLAQQHNQPPPHPPDQQWYDGHRDGSWVAVIDALSPGPTLEMYRTRNELEAVPMKRTTPLVSIEFISCGYAQLHNAPFDQTTLDDALGRRGSVSAYHSRRRHVLQSAMLDSFDRYLARIVQFMPEREQDCLRFAWQLEMGWEDESKAEEATYDGFLPGGTGRFSGIVTKTDAVGPAADGSS